MSYPILTRHTLDAERKGLFRRSAPQQLPPRRDGIAQVFRVDGALTTELTAGDRSWGQIEEVIEVDLREQDITVNLSVPSSEDTFSFTVDARIVTRVDDAVVTVSSGVDNIAPIVTREVEKALRQTGRKYRIDKSGTCEQAMRDELQVLGTTQMLERYGLRVSDTFVRISLDRDAQKHQAALIDEGRKQELIRARYATTSLEDELQRESVAIRANFWLERIAGGEPSLVAIMLARGEAQASEVLADLRAAELTKLQLAHETMQTLIASDKLDGWDIQTPARALLAEMGKIIQEKSFDARQALPAGVGASTAGELNASSSAMSTTGASSNAMSVSVGAAAAESSDDAQD